MVTGNHGSAEETAESTQVDVEKHIGGRMTRAQAESSGRRGMADLHMHSTYSDGCATIEEILQHVEEQTSLDVIAITDHDVVEGALRARDLWADKGYRYDLVVGEEISTNEGHLLGLFIEKRIPEGLSIERSIDLIHEQGGLAVIAHPLHRFFRYSCPKAVMDRIHAAQDVWLDGMESWNASFCGLYANDVAARTNKNLYRLPELGNSDGHTLNAIGSGFSWFSGHTAADVRSAIETGMTAAGGTYWSLQAYYHFFHYRHFIDKDLRASRSPIAMA